MLTRLEEATMISLSDTAELLGVHETTVRRWVRDGNLPKPVRLGPRVVRFRRKDIEQIVKG